ncbi:hypothetical protein A5892_04605 [Halotalea alkalilenta]|uniref:Uncharacterized protein n=2 Tax=Halotalea alkalilenta TaxID=376489 RepID=A0A172YCJ1_9GAMM|nr:hypothetical protein A5892_04605 [Halotalea alkalilenta]
MITSDMIWRAEREIAEGSVEGPELAWLGERLVALERQASAVGMAEERRRAGVSDELATWAVDAYRAS